MGLALDFDPDYFPNAPVLIGLTGAFVGLGAGLALLVYLSLTVWRNRESTIQKVCFHAAAFFFISVLAAGYVISRLATKGF
jgi:hypothetical protein